MKPDAPIPTTIPVTITITAEHLARGIPGGAGECPLTFALAEHEEFSSIPGLQPIVGGTRVDLYCGHLGRERFLVTHTDPRLRMWLILYDGEVEVEVPFTTTLVFEPWTERPTDDREEDWEEDWDDEDDTDLFLARSALVRLLAGAARTTSRKRPPSRSGGKSDEKTGIRSGSPR